MNQSTNLITFMRPLGRTDRGTKRPLCFTHTQGPPITRPEQMRENKVLRTIRTACSSERRKQRRIIIFNTHQTMSVCSTRQELRNGSFDGINDRKRQLVGQRHRWENNIKVDLKRNKVWIELYRLSTGPINGLL
jgi:hypothetical protein